MQEIWAIIFGTSVGFTLAALLTNGHDIVTARRLSFAMPGRASTPELLLGMLLRVVAGPYLLARSAWDAFREGAANPLVFATIVSIACMWGCLSGVVVLDFLGGMPAANTAGN